MSKIKGLELPEGWFCSRIGQYTTRVQYGISKSMNNEQNGPPILRMNNLDGEGFLDLNVLKYVDISEEEIEKYSLEKGDILFNRVNSVELVGKTSIVGNSNLNLVFASYLIRVNVNDQKLLPNYLNYYMNSFLGKKEINRNLRRASGQANINAQELKSMIILVPPLREQHKIIFILSNVDEIIQKTQQLIDQLQLLKKGLTQRLFTEGIGHTEFQETRLGRIPEEWEIVPFTKIITTPRRKVDFLNQSEYLDEGKYPIVDQGQDFIAGYSNDKEKVYRGNLPVIIFGDHTRIFKYIDFPFICGAQGTKVLLPNITRIKPLYCYYILSNLRIKSQGYSRHYRILKEQLIKVPKPEEQNRISFILKNVDDKIENEIEYVLKLKDIKKGLMQHLLTGKKRIPIN